MSTDGTIPVRSFRNTFRLERRIHKIDRWRIPVPFGIPLRGVGYAASIELVVVLAGRLPGIGQAAGAISPVVRFGFVPIVGAYLLAAIEVDGRPAPAALRALLRMRLAPVRVVAWHSQRLDRRIDFGRVPIALDERCARLRPAVITGPARVLVCLPFHARGRRRTVFVEAQPGPRLQRGKVITIERGSRIVIR
jgi:hypothetical protein